MILTNLQRGIDIGPQARKRKIREVTEPFQMENGEWLYPIDWELTPMRRAHKARLNKSLANQ